MLDRHAPDVVVPSLRGACGYKQTFNHAEAISKYASGMTTKAVGALYGVTGAAVRYVIKQKAPHLLKGGNPQTFDHVEALKLLASGLHTCPEIAARMGVRVTAIYGLIKLKAPHLRGIIPHGRKTKIGHIVSRARQGADVPEIARSAQCSEAYARTVIRKEAPQLIEVKPRRSFDVADVINAVAQGASYLDVANRFGINYQQVAYAVRTLAPQFRPSEGPTQGKRQPTFDVAEARELYETQVYTLAALGERYGVTEQAVWNGVCKFDPSMRQMDYKRRRGTARAQARMQISRGVKAMELSSCPI